MCQCGKVEGNTHIEHQMCNNGLISLVSNPNMECVTWSWKWSTMC